jgi:hypothetical protein
MQLLAAPGLSIKTATTASFLLGVDFCFEVA